MSPYSKSDNIFASYQDKIQQFQFDETVVNVFSNMIKRSVPGYENIISMIGVFTQAHAQNNTHCYDLGCSLGASTYAIAANLGTLNCSVTGIDNSPAMTKKCIENLQKIHQQNNIVIECADILDIDFKPCSVVVLNFTLQFIAINKRQELIDKIYSAMQPGGVLILSEKISFPDPDTSQFFTEVHHAFKKTQGYSDLEISQKRSALENYLIPESAEDHIQRLGKAGFKQKQRWFQCLNFASFVAIK